MEHHGDLVRLGGAINDLKLLQLSWVFDLNFQPSFAMLEENNYVEKLVSHLPGTDEILKASDVLRDYVYRKAKGSVRAS